ncbi:MAG TPA: carboxypeptidase regulatory-like domain-containing protein [Thermoanaerobaculia bacterium]|nr:carboxypeptidase regulatory-like domain-containing protein [Thermoanaerobaculia bacterium]
MRVSAASWKIELSDRQLRTPVTLRLARGTYDVAIDAPHYAHVGSHVVIGNTPECIVATLKRLPILSGIVVSRASRQPIGGAVITTDTKDLAISDADGRFAIEPDPESWPVKINVSAAGHADTTVTAPRSRVSAALEEIRMSVGGSIAVEVATDNPVELELRKRIEGRRMSVPMRAAQKAAKRTFEGIEPGSYTVLVSGAEPCQRYGARVELGEGETKLVSIQLEPFRLRLRTELAGEPLAKASVLLQNDDGQWEARLETDESGDASVEMWQGGHVSAWIGAKPILTAPHVEKRTISGGRDVDWFLDVPVREIVGTVIDAASGAEVPGAALSLHISGEDGGLAVRMKADEHGHFRFSPVPYGEHRLKAAAQDFAIAETTYSFAEPEQTRNVTIALEPAARVRLVVTDVRGAPIAGARVLHFRGPSMSGMGTTDAAGTIEIPMTKDETRDVYVVPRDGSFGFMQLRSAASMAIADGTSRIVIRTETQSHEPLANVAPVIRYNTRVIPLEVLQALEMIQGARVRSGSDGRIVLDHMPPGAYEFSPAALDPPVRMVATHGETVAVLTFTR